jgi:hypothetical protein
MRVREDDENLLLRHTADLRGLRDEIRMLGGSHHAMIEREQDLPLAAFHRRKDSHRGPQRTMHAGGPLMLRRAPHAVVDVRRRCDVAPLQSETAATLRRGIFSAGNGRHEAGKMMKGKMMGKHESFRTSFYPSLFYPLAG